MRLRVSSGRLVVCAMFLLGFTATGLLFLYWNLHLMPFMPLQEAIVAEFPDSAPRVEGGRRKMHKQTPLLLRVVVRVPFDPTLADPETAGRRQHYLERIRALAEVHTELAEFELLEVHFYFPLKEKELRERTERRNLKTWQVVDEQGQPVAESAA